MAHLHRARAELDGRPPVAPLDLPELFADMARMNGGVPVACHA